MTRSILEIMTADHQRLGALLDRARRGLDKIDLPVFEEFRAGLLRHIGLEEKILLPAARRARNEVALPVAAQLRIEHSAIASLLVPTPTPEIVTELEKLLVQHNLLEEGPQGMYAQCDALLAPNLDAILARLAAAPQVPVAAHFDGSGVHRTAQSALESASKKRIKK